MNVETGHRRTWEIDARLTNLLGCPVRVRAHAFIPKDSSGGPITHPLDTTNYVLQDGSMIGGEPVYVEGILTHFTRQIAVVFVDLAPLPFDGAADGRVLFRGTPAVIQRGPASVQLHRSQFVEKIPANMVAYWNHLSSRSPQLELQFADLLPPSLIVKASS